MESAVTVWFCVVAIAAATVGGVFFAFSGFVMAGLSRLSPSDAVRAMQAINVAAVRPPLMIAMFGTALAAIGVTVWALISNDPGAIAGIVGTGVYLALVVVLTAGYHVPRNDALAALDASAPDIAAAWRRYVTQWTRANHLRAIGGVGAAAAFVVAALA